MSQNPSKSVFALILIGLGTLLLLNNFDIIDFRVQRYIFKWEVILLFVGLLTFLTKKNKTGIILMAVGGLFLAADVFTSFDADLFDLWPIVFVFAGFILISKSGLATKQPREDGFLNEVALFGGNEIKSEIKEFKGGSITAIFGGSNLDLRRTKLAKGTSELNVFVLFGGSKIIVPEDMSIQIDASAIFGEVADKRNVNNPTSSDTQLRISGTIILGGTEIVN
ncbi:MAG: DUF5668 domain-containing protein [Cyclobacteriaceae bacterium]